MARDHLLKKGLNPTNKITKEMGKMYATQVFESCESENENDTAPRERRLGIPATATPWAQYENKDWILKDKSVGVYFENILKNTCI